MELFTVENFGRSRRGSPPIQKRFPRINTRGSTIGTNSYHRKPFQLSSQERLYPYVTRKDRRFINRYINDVFADFCNNTTLHGFKYVGDNQRTRCERILWVVMLLLAILTGAYFISIVYKKWDETPVIISIGSKPTKITDIPFPAVTICNQGPIILNSTITEILNSADEEEKTLIENEFQEEPCTLWHLYPLNDSSESWESRMKFFKRVGISCEDIFLESCRFLVYDCRTLFEMSLTDAGMCCSFNMAHRDLVFRNTFLYDFNDTRPAVDWDPEDGYPSDTPYDAVPMRPNKTGLLLGLVMSLKPPEFGSVCKYQYPQYLMQIHNPLEMPTISMDGTYLSPGGYYFADVKPRILKSLKSFRSVDKKERQCILSDEMYLKFYRKYTQENCLQECLANYTKHICNCVPYYLPMDNETRLCSQEEGNCSAYARSAFTSGREDLLENADNVQFSACNCPPSCNDVKYFFNLRTQYYQRLNGIGLNVFFKESEIFNYYRSELFGMSDFLASIGGLLGLCVGFSFISFLEIIYFIFVRLWCGRQNRTRRTGSVMKRW